MLDATSEAQNAFMTRPATELTLFSDEARMRSLADRAWEAGIEVLPHEEVDALDGMARVEYLTRLHRWQVDQGITNGPYQAWRHYESLCKVVTDDVTGERCLRPRWESAKVCLTHATVDDLDPEGAERRRKAEHKARLAAAADASLAYVEDVLADTEGVRHPPSIRAKVAMDILDRNTTTSKKTESRTEVTGEITHVVSAAEVIDAKLDRMRDAMLERELAQMSAELNGEIQDIQDAELVEERDVDDDD